MAWYVRIGEQNAGPFEEATVVNMIQLGQLRDGLICEVGSQEWKPLLSHEAFAAAFRTAAPPPPPPARKRGYDPNNLRARDVVAWLAVIVGCAWIFIRCQVARDEAEVKEKAAAAAVEAAKPKHDQIGAWVMAKEFVKKQLKSPGSAEFGGVFSGDYQDPKIQAKHLGDGHYIVTGWVDAQNAFGAKVRADFVVKLKFVGNDEWQLEEPVALVQR